MSLYKNTSTQLSNLKEKPFKLEREIQRLFENNLSAIMGLELVKSEFTIKNKRIDTLGFDPQSKGFVIIEYKRERNSSVFDQGLTYLSLMLANKADFILEYNENKQRSLKRTDVDWSQSRVAFVTPSFTENQKEAVNFKDLAIELWEIKRYEGELIFINPIHKTNATESIMPILQRSPKYQQISNEIKAYTETEHLQGKSDHIVELYEKYKNAILNLSTDIEVKPQKLYVAFKKNNSNFCDIEVQKNSLKIFINMSKGKLDDSKSLAHDVSTVGHWGNGDYMIKIESDVNLEYIMSLVKQAIV